MYLISGTAGDDFLDDDFHHIIPSGSWFTGPLDANVHVILVGPGALLERSGSSTRHHLQATYFQGEGKQDKTVLTLLITELKQVRLLEATASQGCKHASTPVRRLVSGLTSS